MKTEGITLSSGRDEGSGAPYTSDEGRINQARRMLTLLWNFLVGVGLLGAAAEIAAVLQVLGGPLE